MSSLCEPKEMSGWPFGTLKQKREIETVRFALVNLRLVLSSHLGVLTEVPRPCCSG